MSMSEDSKQKAWLEHYQRHFNVEFDWDPDRLSSTTSGRPAHPNHYWYGQEGYLTDEGWQSTGPIRHSGGDDTIVDGLIRQLVSIGDSQFSFVPRSGTTDAIFVVRQLQEKYLVANMAFVDLEKAFGRVPRKVIWWALRKLGVKECIVRLVQVMYANARSHVHVGEGYSEEFDVKVGVHQGSVISQPTALHLCAWSLITRVPLCQPTALHLCAWSLITRVPLWGPLGRPLCWWSCYHRWIA